MYKANQFMVITLWLVVMCSNLCQVTKWSKAKLRVLMLTRWRSNNLILLFEKYLQRVFLSRKQTNSRSHAQNRGLMCDIHPISLSLIMAIQWILIIYASYSKISKFVLGQRMIIHLYHILNFLCLNLLAYKEYYRKHQKNII